VTCPSDALSYAGLLSLASRLADAHLRVLSMPWVFYDGAYLCPVCGGDPDEYVDHDWPDCAWLSSARACGVL